MKWIHKGDPRQGEEFAVMADGDVLAIMPVDRKDEEVHTLHVLGLAHGWHRLSVALIPQTASLVSPRCVESVRILSVSNAASERIPELAALRQVPVERERLLAAVDAAAGKTEDELAFAARALLLGCGGRRSLTPTPTPEGCQAGCQGGHCCSPLCCRLVNRCASLEEGEEERLTAQFEAMENQHRGFHSRQHSFLSAPFPTEEARATLLWHGRQYLGMEADYIERLFGGIVRAAVNASSLNVFAPNAILVLQETFPVHGKREFWDPVVRYLEACRGRGLGVSVMLTSDEKYMAPADWIPLTRLTVRNCWHPGLVEEGNVIAVPFGFKSGFLSHRHRSALSVEPGKGLSGCEAWAKRPLRWNFLGNANSSASRMMLIDQVAAGGGPDALSGRLVLTHTFDDALHGVRVTEYAAVMRDARFTLAPEGVHVESYRLSEALEAGSVPIVSCDDYFAGLFGHGHLLPCVHEWSWSLVRATMEAIEQDPYYPCTLANWWLQYNQRLRDAIRAAVAPSQAEG